MSTRAVPDATDTANSSELDSESGHDAPVEPEERTARASTDGAPRATPGDRRGLRIHGWLNPTRRDFWLALAALLAIGCSMLFYHYGNGEFYRWDEGLYGQFARNALTYDNYVIPLDTHGFYAKEPFSKPPLSFLAVALSFALCGPTIYALRLPFSLSVLCLGVLCFLWGRQLGSTPRRGIWLGFAWASSLLISDASLKWGRTAAIEPMFVLFLAAALYCQARAVTRDAAGRLQHWWSLATGVALMLAFFTKQLAFGLAALPIALVEMGHWRRLGLKWAAARTAFLAGPTLLCGSIWFYLAYLEAGDPLVDMLVDFALAERFAGFTGTMHFNSLNRVSKMLNDVSEPFVWQMGALGLALLVVVSLWHRAAPNDEAAARANPDEYGTWFDRLRASALLLGLFMLTSTVMVELAAKSTLPWYTYSFLVPLTLGGSWLMVGVPAYANDWLRPGDAPAQLPTGAWLGPARAALGVATFLMIVERGWFKFGSQLGVVSLGLGLAIVAVVAVQHSARLRSALRRPSSIALLCVVAAGLVLVSRSRSSYFYRETSAMSELMNAVAREHATRVALHPAIADIDPRYYEITTLFGSAATVASAPWSNGNLQGFDAYVEFRVLPMELRVPAGTRLFRTSGAVAWFGDLKQAPYPSDLVEQLLAQGAVTFEAEHQESERKEGLKHDDLASGGLARGFVPWLSQGMKEHAVTQGSIGVFPPGEYSARFFVRFSCGPQRGGRVGYVKIDGTTTLRKRELPCEDDFEHGDTYEPIDLTFSLHKPTQLEPTVVFRRGRGRLWHDRTVIRRRGTLGTAGSRDATRAAPPPIDPSPPSVNNPSAR